MRLLLVPCALIAVVLMNSANGHQDEPAPSFPAPQLLSAPVQLPSAPIPEPAIVDSESNDPQTIVEPFEETESYTLPEMGVLPEGGPLSNRRPTCGPAARQYPEPTAQPMPPRRHVHRRYYTYSDPHQVEYYSPNLPYYDPAHGVNSYRPLPAHSRHYRGPADRHNTGWGFSY